MAKVLAKELEPFKLMFIEEPVLSEHVEALKEIANHTATPIALGERLYLALGLQDDPARRAASTSSSPIRPMPAASPRRARSPRWRRPTTSRWRCIARWVRSRWPPACSSTRSATTPSSRSRAWASTTTQTNDLLDYISDPAVFAYADGHVAIPAGPGLGITVNEEAVTRGAATGHRWRKPVWRHDDGSFAEW